MQCDRDTQRIELTRRQMLERGLDALVCAFPSDVLMLSGYWPVAGNTLAVATLDSVALLSPEGAVPLTERGWADSVLGYELGSLKHLRSLTEVIQPKLGDLLQKLKLENSRIGFESGPWVQPAPYAAMTSFGASMVEMLRVSAPRARIEPADDLLEELRLINTAQEIRSIRTACHAAELAFEIARAVIRPGKSETQVAAEVRGQLMQRPQIDDRCDGFAYCMSGPNAAEAYKFFQHTRDRKLCVADTVLVHCNSHVNGYWTDITRTFYLGEPEVKKRAMYEAIFAARQAALAAIHPGARCADVDRAARSLMEARGFGEEFKNPLGHGVGFAAINHNARPRLHPLSPDVLREGMVFNVEPAIYVAGDCGMRQCEMVACGANGPELLTDFQSELDELVIA